MSRQGDKNNSKRTDTKRQMLAKQCVKVYAHNQTGVFFGLCLTMNQIESAKLERERGKLAYQSLIHLQGTPSRIGHDYKAVNILDINIDLEKMKTHQRMQVFFYKGLNCTAPGCDKVGSRLVVGMASDGTKHVDVYTDDWQLMTVDHHIPKCQGGTDDIENLFPMCAKCNTNKGGIMPKEIAA